MKRLPISVGLFLMLAAAASAQVWNERDGLPNTLKKLEAGEKVVVAYFGGSITHGSGASRPELCYRELFTSFLRKRFPKAQVEGIHAAVGGTGSWLGAFRLKTDVIEKNPDLVLVEFAVNDGDTPEKQVLAAMEGIVRQIRTAKPEAEILFVYTLARYHLDAYRGGRPERAQWHEKVANYYRIPSVDMGMLAAQKINGGELSWGDFSLDDAHPTDRGYAIYEEALEGFISRLADKKTKKPTTRRSWPGRSSRSKSSKKGPSKEPAAVKLPRPMTPLPMENGIMVPFNKAEADDKWSPGAKSPGWKFGTVLASDTPGATVTITFRGDCVGVYDDLGPDTGDWEVSVDGGPWRRQANFDAFAKTMYRIHARALAENLNPRSAHQVRLRVAGEVPAGSKGRWTRIGFFLVNGELVDEKEAPAGRSSRRR